MAKKKHSKSASAPIPAKALVSPANQSDPRFREDRVRRIYNNYQRSVTKVKTEKPKMYEGLDYDQVRMKRRIAATVATLDEVEQRMTPFCPEIPDKFTIEKDWTIANAIPAPAYDLEEELTTTLLGAAIWMLDKIRDNQKIRELVPLFPKGPEQLSSTRMPQIYDLSHCEEMLMGMLYLLQNRNRYTKLCAIAFVPDDLHHPCIVLVGHAVQTVHHRLNDVVNVRFATGEDLSRLHNRLGGLTGTLGNW